MRFSQPLAGAILDAIETPLLVLDGQRVAAANRAARDRLGGVTEGRDIRLTLRHPRVLAMLAADAEASDVVRGIGNSEREWQVDLLRLDPRHRLLRLTDLSATRAAEKIRTDFVANASHELRTPLASIIGYAETLAEDAPLPDEMRRRFGEAVEREGRRMLGLVDDLMDLSRISADRFVAPSGTVDLAALLDSALHRHRTAAERCGVRLVSEIDDDLPRIAGDPAQLAQLLDNLLSNALRYGCTEGGTITARASATPTGVLLAVVDEGEGIAPEHLPRLTERFYRADPARSRDGGGTGLGLAIVKHIVERHRGELRIRSTPGEGTTVIVDLPIVTKL